MRRTPPIALLLCRIALSVPALSGCDRVVAWMDGDVPTAATSPMQGPQRPKRGPSKRVELIKPIKAPLGTARVVGTRPRGQENALDVLAWMRTRLSVGEVRDLGSRIVGRSWGGLSAYQLATGLIPIAPPRIAALLRGDVVEVRYNGGRALVRLRSRGENKALWFFLRVGHWRLDLGGPLAWQPANRGPDHAFNRNLTLADATASIHGTGPLVAVIDTSVGAIACKLETATAPRSVAHFVGLARGLRATLDRSVRPPVWVRARVYDGTRFHRAVDGLAVIGGSGPVPTDGIGFAIDDEFSRLSRHSEAGVLGFVNNGPTTTAATFYITLRAASELDDRYNIFGRCRDTARIERIAGAAAGSVRIESVRIRRGF